MLDGLCCMLLLATQWLRGTCEGDTIQHSAESHAGSLVTQGLLAQKNLAPEEFVALMGSFTLGFCGEEKKGYHTRWCMNPYVFDNTYF